MKTYLLLGEQPNNALVERRPSLALRPDHTGVQHAANRLLHLSDLSYPQYLQLFPIRRNALPRLGKWSTREARRNVGEVLQLLSKEGLSGIVVLGSRAASALTWWVDDPTPFDWAQISVGGGAAPAVLVPHPSGRNRWWNDAANRRLASSFFVNLWEEACR